MYYVKIILSFHFKIAPNVIIIYKIYLCTHKPDLCMKILHLPYIYIYISKFN